MTQLPDEEEVKKQLDKIKEHSKKDLTSALEAMDQIADFGSKVIDSMTDEKKWEEEYDADLLLSDLQKFPRERFGEICVFLGENIIIKTEYTRIEKTKINLTWDGFFSDPKTPITFDFILFDGFPYEEQDEYPSDTYVKCRKCAKEIIKKGVYTIDNKEEGFFRNTDPVTPFLLYLVAHFSNTRKESYSK